MVECEAEMALPTSTRFTHVTVRFVRMYDVNYLQRNMCPISVDYVRITFLGHLVMTDHIAVVKNRHERKFYTDRFNYAIESCYIYTGQWHECRSLVREQLGSE